MQNCLYPRSKLNTCWCLFPFPQVYSVVISVNVVNLLLFRLMWLLLFWGKTFLFCLMIVRL